MVDIFTYIVPLPRGIREMVTPCADGYTVYLDESLSQEGRLKAYLHALYHIEHDDFSKDDVQMIELEAHGYRLNR